MQPAGARLQTAGVYLVSVSVCRHGCARGLCLCRPVSVRTRVLHPPHLTPVLGWVCHTGEWVSDPGGCLWDLCMSPLTRVCTRGGCVCTHGLHPLPGHPWGASRRGVNTAPTAGGVWGRPPPHARS